MCSKQSNCQGGGTNSMSVEATALAEVMEESGQNDDTIPVFFKDLTKLYTKRLRQLGVELNGRIISTRLKGRLSAALPD